MARVFVTAGSGFIGGRLIGRLLAEGHGLRALARSSTSAASDGSFETVVEKAREQLGYAPVRSIADGLAELRAA